MKILNSYFSQDSRLLFLLLVALHALATVIQQEFILMDDLYYNTYGEQLAIERIEALIAFNRKWEWVGYAVLPFVLLLQVVAITICLNIGTILVEYKVKFKQLFGMVLKATLVFAIMKLVLVISIWLFADLQNFEDLMQFNYHSVLAFFDLSNIPAWLFYPLYMLNISQLLFFALLGFGMVYLVKIRFSRALSFILSTYGTGLLIWVLFIVFLQLNLQ